MVGRPLSQRTIAEHTYMAKQEAALFSLNPGSIGRLALTSVMTKDVTIVMKTIPANTNSHKIGIQK
jgi:hypothetical protein